MKAVLATTQLGHKKERSYGIARHCGDTQPIVFTVKGVGKNFMLFDGEQYLQSFKTLTECKEYIRGATA
jgi:hypothetical protein